MVSSPPLEDTMRSKAICLMTLALIGHTLTATAQNAAAPADPLGFLVGHPSFATIVMEVDVNKSAKETWARVGKFCDIREWAQMDNCTILAGKDGEIGAVRSISTELMVGRSDLSYTYTVPPRTDRTYNQYHGTLEAKPVTATTSKLIYTIVYDGNTFPDEAAREKYSTQMRTTFTRFINNMKVLAEGGTLPPPKK
jgi:hypothetical protein